MITIVSRINVVICDIRHCDIYKNPFLGNFGITKEPVESPITTKIPALLNDSSSTGKSNRAIFISKIEI